MLRFLSGRKKGRTTQNIQKVQQFPGIPQPTPKKAQKNCLLCKVIVLDGTDLTIEIHVSQFDIIFVL